jgi:hypothetical protein
MGFSSTNHFGTSSVSIRIAAIIMTVSIRNNTTFQEIEVQKAGK